MTPFSECNVSGALQAQQASRFAGCRDLVAQFFKDSTNLGFEVEACVYSTPWRASFAKVELG